MDEPKKLTAEFEKVLIGFEYEAGAFDADDHDVRWESTISDPK